MLFKVMAIYKNVSSISLYNIYIDHHKTLFSYSNKEQISSPCNAVSDGVVVMRTLST